MRMDQLIPPDSNVCLDNLAYCFSPFLIFLAASLAFFSFAKDLGVSPSKFFAFGLQPLELMKINIRFYDNSI